MTEVISEEYQYLNLLQCILNRGTKKSTRTGVFTRSIVGGNMRFSLWDSTKNKRILPLLTTKEVKYDLVLSELLWFISGNTDAKVLDKQGVKIWNANASRQFLDSVGLSHRQEGDLGPIYSFNWRHFGAEYINSDTDYTGQGIDQLQNVITKIKNNPFDRRLLVTAWNPVQLDQVALPPCHVLYQFIVEPDELDLSKPKYLNVCVYQRSADFPLGIPFNIASYATLTHIVSHLTGLVPKELVYFMGDCHIYDNQIDKCLEQLTRNPYNFPYLTISDRKQCNIDQYTKDDFIVENYTHHPFIKFPFAT